jgi:hypothetical protein
MITLPLSSLRRRDFKFHVASRLLLVTTLAAHALPAQPEHVAANPDSTAQTSSGSSSNPVSPVSIQYTGRLFGYYRIEPDIDLQRAYDAEVDAKKSNPTAQMPRALLARPVDFLSHRKLNSSDLLLGMGDNFGPEFGSSIQQAFDTNTKKESTDKNPCFLDAPVLKEGDWKTYAPESLYKSENRKPNLADCDNVTRFLMAAGYRAVVPGREDFLYSGTWLRRIAYLLRGASAAEKDSSNPDKLLKRLLTDTGWVMSKEGKCNSGLCAIASYDHELHLLAANLRVTVPPAKAVKPSTGNKSNCPLLFATDLGTSVECSESDSTISASMGWLTRVDGALRPEIHASIDKQALSSLAFARQLIKNEISILQTIVNQHGIQTSSSDKAEGDAVAGDLQIINKFKPDATTAISPFCGAAPATLSKQCDPCPTTLEKPEGDLPILVSAMVKATKYFSSSDSCRIAFSPLLDESALRSAQRLLLQLIFNEQQNAGFTIATIPGDKSGDRKVLIIGVVGKETMQEVTPDFFSVYPDTFDCDPAASPASSNPVCILKEKLLNHANPPGSPAERDLFLQAADKNEPYKITVGDPLVAAEAVLRAVWANGQHIDRTILMAQMPTTEAEEVGAQLRYDFADSSKQLFENQALSKRPHVDLVLSEAQDEHISGNQITEINPWRSTVVLSPPLAYQSIEKPNWYPPSIATISPSGGSIPNSIKICNTLGYMDATTQKNCKDDSAETRTEDVKTCQQHCIAATTIQEGKDDQTSSAGKSPQSTHDTAKQQRIATTITQEEKDDQLSNSPKPPHDTAATLLEEMLATTLPHLPQDPITPPLLTDLTGRWEKCTSTEPKAPGNCQNQVLTNYLLHTLQIHTKTSATMLKRRDFWFGDLATGYDDYEVCDNWRPNNQRAEAYCKLHVALDRVLWRGDYAVRVLVDGTTLASVLKSSSEAPAVETTLLANDIHQEWLSTFGFVSTQPTDLVTAASGPESFSLPGISDCNVTADPPLGKKSTAPTPKPYCVDGFTIAPDAAYWIATSSQLAKDQSTYKAIQTFTQPHGTRFVDDTEKILSGSGETFLTTAIASEIIPVSAPHNRKRESVNWADYSKTGSNSLQDDLARIEAANQRRRIMQLDISKFAAGYTFTAPSINDTTLGNDLSGVSNTQATTPHSAELDLEAAARTITTPVLWQGLAFGIQNDFEFDHKRTGNTSGKPATVSYQLNSETAGAFAQLHIPQIFGKKPDPSPSMQSPRNLPRFYWVIAPYQYQRQIVGSPVYFGYLTPPYTKNPSQQLTVTIPVSDGFIWKSGLRLDAGGFKQSWAPDSGSYAELGPEYVIQNKILYGISMPDLIGLSSPVTTHCSNPCFVTAGTSITSAVQGYYKDNSQTLSGSSHLVPLTRTVHAGGLYWTAHVQKVLTKAKTYSVSFDTAGDSYLLPGSTLPTQTRYAINNKLAFNMNFLGNLSFSPTYSVYNFENQGVSAERISVNTTSFEVMLKWYYSRDTQSPRSRLLWFTGPKSGDQTTSTKLK